MVTISGGGGSKPGGRGVQLIKFYPYNKNGGGGAEKVVLLAMLKVGHNKFSGSFNTGA